MGANSTSDEARTGAPAPGLHATWRGLGWDADRWPHFTARELSCKCGGKHCDGEYFHDPDFLDALERFRGLVGRSVIINSGRRCRLHNIDVGGARLSQHTLGIAADVSLVGMNAGPVASAAAVAGFRGMGFGMTILHLDIRPARASWYYPGGKAFWRMMFGFDVAARFKKTGRL